MRKLRCLDLKRRWENLSIYRLILLSIIFMPIHSIEAQSSSQADTVVIGGDVAEIVSALGAENQLLARDATSLYPDSITKLPSIGYLRQLSVESILSLAPRRVLVSAEARPQEVLQQLKSSGVEVIIVPAGYDFVTLANKIKLLGKVLNAPQRAQALLAELKSQESEIAKLTPLQIRPLLLLSHGGGAPMIAGQHSAGEVLHLAGVAWLPPFNGYKRVGGEGIVSLSPQVILISPQALASLGGAQKLWHLPGLQFTPAAKNQAIIEINEQALLGFGLRTPTEILRLHRALAALQ